MIKYSNGASLAESVAELPDLRHADELFLDVETTGLHPYTGDRICGFAVASGDGPVFYVPIRHKSGKNLLALEWLRDVVSTAKAWINHNVKFDAHFCAEDGAMFTGRLVDTMTLAKIYYSDEFRYSLEACIGWILHMDSSFKRIPSAYKTEDYSTIPPYVLGEYACNDVIHTRLLYRWLQRELPEQSKRVVETETLLTPVLFDMERRGMKVDVIELKMAEFKTLRFLLEQEEAIHRKVGRVFDPTSNDDCYDLFCNSWGLPVLGWTKTKQASFDADALKQYLKLPEVTEEQSSTAQMILDYREQNTLLTMFIRPYQELQFNGILHPSYNQLVRTGRMSCADPNAQQLSHEAKLLVHPWNFFLGCDYSQLEFRVIVDYIEDEKAIAAYLEDPDTDFHLWVAKMCGIPRAPAKNINFAMGYGSGEPKVIRMLSTNPELIASIPRGENFEALCKERGQAVYKLYHDTLPTLRSTSRLADRTARTRGYVYNRHGRRRHLRREATYRAFNTLCQGEGADLVKERTVAIAPRYCKWMQGIDIVATVHDEILFDGPKEQLQDPSFCERIRETLEHPDVPLRVPLRVSMKRSGTSWADLE